MCVMKVSPIFSTQSLQDGSALDGCHQIVLEILCDGLQNLGVDLANHIRKLCGCQTLMKAKKDHLYFL